MDLLLDPSNADQVQLYSVTIKGEMFAKIEHFLTGAHTGEGVAVIVHRLQSQPPFQGHPPRHRAVDTTGQEQECPAGYTHRETPRPGSMPGENKGFFGADFDKDP